MKIPKINTSDGRFKDSDVKTGEAGTIVTANWLNAVQDAFTDVDNEKANKSDADKKIDKTAISDSVTSSSSTNVASSKSVKSAYDKVKVCQGTLTSKADKTYADAINTKVDNKVRKAGDTISGKLVFESSNQYSPLILQDNKPRSGGKGTQIFGQILQFHMPNQGSWFVDLAQKEVIGEHHEFVIHSFWKDIANNAWSFRHDGHIYGSHGRLVVESELNTKADKSYADKKIDKTAISDSVTSSSSTNVASSKAVKTAYDKVVAINTKADNKVSKTGDTITGKLLAKDVSYPFENQNTTSADYSKFHSCTMMQALIPSFNLRGGLYIEQNKRLYHAISIQLFKPGYTLTWNFRSDGHIYGLKGRIVVESELNTKADKSYADAINAKANNKADKSYADAINAKTNNKSQVAVLIGIVKPGGTIPLPAGFTENQCNWMVSQEYYNKPASVFDKALEETGYYDDTRHQIFTRHYTGTKNANYIVIGVK